MRLEQWDKEVKPKLSGINFDAKWIQYYAEKIMERVRGLPCRPDFETNAEGEINTARVMIKRTLAMLDDAAKEYVGKPTE